ncbi:hypothetical protein F975_01836 [Acinetobacter sp. ANC 3789]|uniref:hypothetical protein n=1 Tax=Acinetobacter sp. ANC 3789 TaxID=1217714 RepID=UPI0002D07DBA|nr:hypothetical protein [Acinetobacter sp. ANC 3789]ENU80083.1 hypothetical protein F975_01836 [Acinetobacter sp. ANC 3789]
MEIELLNFNHNCMKVGEYYIGKYKFLVNEEHIDNLKNISKNSSIRINTEIIDNKVVKNYSEHPAAEGDFKVTAILILDDEDINKVSILYSEFNGFNLSDDLILILSFLTGRQIYKSEFKGVMNKKYYSNVVSDDYFSSGRSKFLNVDESLLSIKNDGLEHQFFNFTFGQSLNDLPSLIAYSSFTFDAVVTKWAKKNKFTSYNLKDKRLFEKIKCHLTDKLEKSILLKFKNEVLKFLLKNQTDITIANDIVARMNISNQPSALYKIQKFLEHLKLYNESFDDKYLKTLNRVRNIMLHNGQIYKEDKISVKQSIIINAAVPLVLFSIIEYYFCKSYLKINDTHYLQNFYDVINFLEAGVWRGQKVFEESFEDYLTRVSDIWEESV